MAEIPRGQTITVTGATGNIGRELVAELAKAGHAVRAVARHLDRAALPAGVEVAPGDLDHPESLLPAFEGSRRVFLLGSHADMRGLLAVIRRAGAEHVVFVSSRSVVDGDPGNAVVRMWRTAEEAITGSGVAWTFLRPSGFASNALRFSAQLRAGDRVRAPFANARIAVIDPADIARVASVVLSTEGHQGRSYELSGPEALLPGEQVAILARVLGRKLDFEPQPDEEALADLGRTAPPGFAEAFHRFFTLGEFDDARIVPTVAELTGRQPRTFEEWARSHRDEFR